MESDLMGKSREALVNQVVADVGTAQMNAHILRGPRGSIACEVECNLGDLRFAAVGVACHERNTFAIQLARLKVHSRIRLRWILAQRLVEQNEWFDEIDPVGVCDRAQTFDSLGYLRLRDRLRRVENCQRLIEQHLKQGELEKWRDIP